jgi:TolA-binding protein
MIVGKAVAIPVLDGIHDGGVGGDFGFFCENRTMFYAFQAFELTLPTAAGSAESDPDLGPAAIQQVKARLGANLVSGTLVEEHDPRFAVQLRYAFIMCGSKVIALDRYKKIGKVVLRCESEPMLIKPNDEQLAEVDAIADKATAQLLDAATVYDEPKEAANRRPHTAAASGQKNTPPNNLRSDTGMKTHRDIPTARMTAGKSNPTETLNHRAELALAVAEKLKAGGDDRDAYERFKFVVREYPRSPSADAAKQAISAYEADADFMSKYKSPATQPAADAPANSDQPDSSAKAKSMLSLAEDYVSAGRNDLARDKYQAVIEQFPNTPFAETAKQKIAALTHN